MRKLVFIHGRSQEKKDSVALKKEWVESLHEGLAKNNLSLPIIEADIRFPYYGQTLYDLREGMSEEEAAEIIIRGDSATGEEEQFIKEVMAEVLGRALERAIERGELSPEEVPDLVGADVIEKGFLNWRWVQKTVEWLDENVPGASGLAIALVTQDVADYLRNMGLRDVIETGVRKALVSDEETVLVSHSLGTVIAYNLVRREAEAQGWKIPLFLTLGSPLGVARIRQALAPLSFPRGVGAWFNAMDPDDIVALYPLEDPYFAVSPIDNYEDVDNQTSNQHGITGYLSDPVVARKIYDALV